MTELKENKSFDYDVALSFAGEDREYVEDVATFLKDVGIKVFYDKFEADNLWGKNLYDHLYASVYNVKLVNSMSGLTDNLRTRLLSNFAEGYFSVMINVYALPTKEERIEIIEQLKLHRNISQIVSAHYQY